MYEKKSGRTSFRSNRRQGYKRNSYFSNSKVRNSNKGNIRQQYLKYIKLAKEASSSGDRIQSEYYNQFADHYSRLMLELGIVFDEFDYNQDSNSISKTNEQKDDSNEASAQINVSDDSANDNLTNNDSKNQNTNNDSIIQNTKNAIEEAKSQENDSDSIESVSFLSSPAKKKVKKTKRDSA